MPKIPECHRCLYCAHDHHLVCVPHPTGPESDTCLDFNLDPTLEGKYFKDLLGLQRQMTLEPDENLWEPEGANYYNGQLILQPRYRRTREEQLYLLNTHPMFTGRCPACGAETERDYRAVVHWDCPCGWMDDSI